MAGIKPNDKVTITNEEGEITIKKKKERWTKKNQQS
jgi:hypothetical protein